MAANGIRQRIYRITAIALLVIWPLAIAAVVITSWRAQSFPDSGWLLLFGPLMIVTGARSIIFARDAEAESQDRIWGEKDGGPPETPALLYALLGVGVCATGLVLTAVGLLTR